MVGRAQTARGRVLLASTVAAVLGLQGLALGGAEATVPAARPPVAQPTSTMVTADALPTVQVDGVVRAQVVIGSTVYVGGEFTTARPAGAAPGTSTVKRTNLLAYDIRTGVLLTTFTPATLNGPVRTLAVSSDKKTLYVGGSFTKVGFQARGRLAAFSAATGSLRRSAIPSFNGPVDTIAVVSTTAYVGGAFGIVDGRNRSRLAAFTTSTGALTSWAPTASDEVQALVATPDKTKIVVGGSFTTLNTTTTRGLGAVSARTGASKTWLINKVVKDYGPKSAILGLAADADTVYGVGYAYGGGNFEGTFAANPADGSIKWLEDCHGDSYDVAPIGNAVYVVGHPHFCANVGGFPDTSPRTRWQRAVAFTKTAKGTLATNSQLGAHYGDFGGQPAPSLYNWFPDLTPGTFTGATQAAWSLTGTTSYLSAGGEFTAVNGKSQQGLVRFAIPTLAPNAQGPQLETGTEPQLEQSGTSAATVTWAANSDRDDKTLTYAILRDGQVVHTATVASTFWKRPTSSWTDTGLTTGRAYRYQVRATDPDGNTVTSASTSITLQPPAAAATPTPTPTPSASATPSAGAGG